MATAAARRSIPGFVVTLVAVAGLGACGGDEPASTTDSGPTTVAAVTLPATPDTADLPVETPAPPDTADLPTSTMAPTTVDTAPVVTGPQPVSITVTVGVDSGPDRVDTVPLGSLVTLTVVNPNSADEFHLHGYDLGDGAEIPAGQPSTFTFTADTAGRFELESHDTHDVIMVLDVL